MSIRAVTKTDFEAWRQLWAGYLHFYRDEVPDDVTARTFERLCDRSEGFLGLVAEDGRGRLVGLAHLVFHPSTWTAGQYCYLEDLYVEPSARGSGTGEQLIRAVYGEADRLGAVRVYWETQEFNGPARSLYDTLAHKTSFVIYER